MKKTIFVCIAFFALLIVPMTVGAYDASAQIDCFVQSHKYTQDATSVVFGKYCVVGVRTKGILLKSDSQKYVDEIDSGIKDINEDIQYVYVTTNINEVLLIKDVRQKIDEGMTEWQVYNYVKQKYPNAIDKILLSANI